MKKTTPMKKYFTSMARKNSGFTLIEVMMALLIMGVAAACSYDILRTGLIRAKHLQAETREKREAAIALALLSRDIRSAFLNSDQAGIRFVGHHDDLGDRLDFYRTGGAINAEPQIEPVSYFLSENR